MIDEINKEVALEVTDSLLQHTSLKQEQVSHAVETVSGSILEKAKYYVDNGKLMELKAAFEKGSDGEKQELIEEAKAELKAKISGDMSVSESEAETITETTIPVMIKVAKKHLLGPDGKIGFTDIPKILAFVKSGGKSTKPSGGLFGSIFGG